MNVLRDLGESLGNTVLENVGRAVGRAQERTPLPVDLLESDDAYLAVFDAPGADSMDVQVQFRDGAVEVRVDRFRDFYEGVEMRYPGRGLALDGRVTLPAEANVDPSEATALLQDNGTLHVRVPKVDAERSAKSNGHEEVADSDGEDVDGQAADRESTDSNSADSDSTDGQ